MYGGEKLRMDIPNNTHSTTRDIIHGIRPAEDLRIRSLDHQAAQQPEKTFASARRLYDSVRQIIETVNSQLGAQFSIETNHAHTFRGLCARLYTKLTAHTLCIYINRLLGVHDYLQIKKLAFPN